MPETTPTAPAPPVTSGAPPTAAPAASPAPPAAPASSPALRAPQQMTPAEWRQARQSLQFAPPPPSSPDSAPAEPAAQATSTDVSPSPASEPGSPAESSAKRKKSADTRIQELLRDRAAEREARLAAEAKAQALEARLAASATPPADQSPPPEWKRYASRPDAPKPEQFEDYGEYTAAMALYIADRRLAEREQAARAAAQTRQARAEFAQAYERAAQKVSAALERDPALADDLHPGLLAIKPTSQLAPGERPGPHNFIADQIVFSDTPLELMRYFSAHPEEFDRLCQQSPAQIVRAIGRLEATVAAGSSPSTTTPSAPPPPPTTLGRKPAAPLDEEADAIRTGDVRKFRQILLKKDQARLGQR